MQTVAPVWVWNVPRAGQAGTIARPTSQRNIVRPARGSGGGVCQQDNADGGRLRSALRLFFTLWLALFFALVLRLLLAQRSAHKVAQRGVRALPFIQYTVYRICQGRVHAKF